MKNQLSKLIAGHADEGLAGWELPQQEDGFFQAWRQLAGQHSLGNLLGLARLESVLEPLGL